MNAFVVEISEQKSRKFYPCNKLMKSVDDKKSVGENNIGKRNGYLQFYFVTILITPFPRVLEKTEPWTG